MVVDPKQRRAARHAQGDGADGAPSLRKAPITVERVTDAALEIVMTQGYDALTMRSVAAVLGTGPASLYAHVVNKADIDELIIGRLCSEVVLPEPNAALWREQIIDVCTQLRDQYLKYPGISRAALAMEVTDLDVLRINEAMLAILIGGGILPKTAAWTIDALFLYIGAYAMEAAIVAPAHGLDSDDWRISPEDRDELVTRFSALPADQFPQITRYAADLTSGVRHERFDFTLSLIVGNLPEGSRPARSD